MCSGKLGGIARCDWLHDGMRGRCKLWVGGVLTMLKRTIVFISVELFSLPLRSQYNANTSDVTVRFITGFVKVYGLAVSVAISLLGVFTMLASCPGSPRNVQVPFATSSSVALSSLFSSLLMYPTTCASVSKSTSSFEPSKFLQIAAASIASPFIRPSSYDSSTARHCENMSFRCFWRRVLALNLCHMTSRSSAA
jgi:hypothetical protein